MSNNNSGAGTKIPIWITVIIVPIVIALITTLISTIIPIVIKTPLPPPTTIPPCISADDALVRFHILRNQEEIAVLAPGESAELEPDLTVYLQVEIRSVSDKTLPKLECTWTNTDIPTGGKLIHKTGCNIDYKSGQSVVTDALSMQLNQPSCPALGPYPIFILSKP